MKLLQTGIRPILIMLGEFWPLWIKSNEASPAEVKWNLKI